ncbi:MAG: hypothetical protein ACPG05_03265 [Bdellovibrionales bacterium]
MNTEYFKYLAEIDRKNTPEPSLSRQVNKTREEVLAYIAPLPLESYQKDQVLLRPWECVPGTGESVKVSDVLRSIKQANPEDLYNIISANRRLPKEQQWFNNYQNIVMDTYWISRWLTMPQSYVNTVNQQIKLSLRTREQAKSTVTDIRQRLC